MSMSDQEIWIYGIAMALCLLASAFFSSSETAVTALSRARLFRLVGEGNKRARLVSRMRKNKESLIGSILIGNNAVNISLTALATTLTINVLGDGSVWLTSVLLTVVVVIFCEILPKTYAIQHSERTALMLAPVLYTIVLIISPVANAISWCIRSTLHLFGVDITRENTLISATDVVRGTIELHHLEGQMVKQDKDMLGSILDLNDVEVRHITVHRTYVDAIDANSLASKMIEQALGTGHSRLPFYQDDQDNIIGILHVKDLIQAINTHGSDLSSSQVLDLLQAPWFVPESTKLRDQLLAFRDQRKHIACVVDEYGTWQGIVTLEDIIEEIVGNIEDEHDEQTSDKVTSAGDGVYYVAGDMPIRDLNRELDWDLEDDEAATIAGLVLDYAKAIPPRGTEIMVGSYRLTVIDKQATRIKRVRLEKIQSNEVTEEFEG